MKRCAVSRAALVAAAFTSGAVLLGVEIAASRVVAPFFGNSLFVWGALIGVVLTGLSVGYWVGGALADRAPSPALLLGVLLLGAVAVLAIPLVDQTVLEAVVRWDPGPRADPLLAAAALFGPASVILASVTPIAVKLLTRSVTTLGRTAGRLFSVSTAGSIAGTFVTAFWLIPAFGTDELLAFAGAALFAAAVPVALAERLPLAALVAGLAAAGAIVLGLHIAPKAGGTLSRAASQNWSPVFRSRGEAYRTSPIPTNSGFKLVYTKDTRYHHLSVVDDVDSRFLRFDNAFQTGMYLRQPNRTRFPYTDFFDLGLAYRPEAKSLLFVGLGGGSAPRQLRRDFPRLDLQAVELDPVVADVARTYFHLPRTLPVTVEDGRRYLVRNDRRWDVIALDTFYADALPFHLTTREFVELVRSRLAPGGVVVVNTIGALEGSSSKLFRSLYRTYRTVFPTVEVHPVYIASQRAPADIRNIVLVATAGPPPSRDLLATRWRSLRSQGAPDLKRAILDRWERAVPTDGVPTLTDDYAPTDALLLAD